MGRILMGGFFLIAGFNHFARLNMMAGYARMKGIPAPTLSAGGSGILLLLGGASLLLGFHPRIGVILPVIFLLPTSLMINNFWTIQDPASQDGGDGPIPKEYRHNGFALDDTAHPATLAYEPWPIGSERSPWIVAATELARKRLASSARTE